MHTWQVLRPRKPKRMDRTRGSGDSEEEEKEKEKEKDEEKKEEEAQREWRDEGKVWNQLGDWAAVACIVVGVSQAGRQEKGPGCECCATGVCVRINTRTQKQLRLRPVRSVFGNISNCPCEYSLNVSWSSSSPVWLHHLERRSQVAARKKKKSPTSPEAGVKVEGKSGWLAPTQAVSTQQLSVLPHTHTTSSRYSSAHQIHFVFLPPVLSLEGSDVRNRAQTGTLWAHVVAYSLAGRAAEVCRDQISMCRRNNMCRVHREPRRLRFAHKLLLLRSMPRCRRRWPGVNTIGAWSTSAAGLMHKAYWCGEGERSQRSK